MNSKRLLPIAISLLACIPVVCGAWEVEPTTANINEVEPFPNSGSTGMTEFSGTAMPVMTQDLKKTFEGFGFDDNALENEGFRFIPPDPIGAAGHSRVIAVVNTMIESRNKGGALKWRTSLANFFAPVSPATFTFDPKIIYDQYEDRFVVVTLEVVFGSQSQDPLNVSRILLAVSRSGTPTSPTSNDWYFTAIDAKQTIGPFDIWADYPGLEADEEAVYVTSNMFTFEPFGLYGGVRLWIVDKDEFYDGGPASVAVYDPYAIAGGLATTTMPAQVFGDGGVGGAGSTTGTYLVSYSGLTFGGPDQPEAVQVIAVDDPVGKAGGPFFSQQFVILPDIEDLGGVFGFPPLPDAPQADSEFLIEVNDRRALDAVWRDGFLWLTTTINPNFGSELGETSATWFKLDTTDPGGLVVLDDYGVIGGEEIAENTTTFFPSVAVNRLGEAMFGFSASAPDIYAGAFVAGRKPNDLFGTLRTAKTVKAGEGPYKRYFGGTRNRWGDYSGIAVDPSNEKIFWVFNEFADEPGSPTDGEFGPEDGRWGTAWGRAGF